MATASLFPGQGSQHVGMAQDLYDESEKARARLQAADKILGLPLTDYMFGQRTSDEAEAKEQLTQTEITQPALYTHSLAALDVLEEKGITFDMAAGHSLGEYSALAAAGALSFEDGLRLVRRRGELMAEAGTKRPGSMAAVIGMDDDVVREACLEASDAERDEVVQPANYNSPGQVVISGDEQAVKRASSLLKERGGRRIIPLPVSGAFHSPLMAYARDGLASAISKVTITEPGHPVYLNVSAEPTTDPDTIKSGLLEQLLSPVRWAETLQNMEKDGAELFVEVGAGKVLSGLAKRTLGRRTETLQAGTADQLDEIAARPTP